MNVTVAKRYSVIAISYLSVVVVSVALTFLGVRFYDYQSYKSNMKQELDKKEKQVSELIALIGDKEKAIDHIVDSVDKPLLYEAIPLPGVKDEK